MMWVNDTLPPRALARWPLMTIRLSHSSLTGTDRTEVAVGTASEASMFWTVRAGAPRRTVKVGSSLAAACAAGGCSLGTGLVVPLAGSAAFDSGRGLATGAGVGVGSVVAAGAWGCWVAWLVWLVWLVWLAFGAGGGSAGFAGAGSACLVGAALAAGAPLELAPL